MKIATSCDEVFEVLTRAPFPAGSEKDADVELHLAACCECRQLAEALRPAAELFHEALRDESPELPAYRGRVGRATARAISTRTVPHWLPLDLAAACLLCTSAFMFSGRALPPVTAPGPVAWPPVVNSWAGAALLENLQLPVACRQTPRSDRTTGLAQQCCTRCHHADSKVAAAQAIAKIVVACLICHNERQSGLSYSEPHFDDGDRPFRLRDLLAPEQTMRVMLLTLRCVEQPYSRLRDDNGAKSAVAADKTTPGGLEVVAGQREGLASVCEFSRRSPGTVLAHSAQAPRSFVWWKQRLICRVFAPLCEDRRPLIAERAIRSLMSGSKGTLRTAQVGTIC